MRAPFYWLANLCLSPHFSLLFFILSGSLKREAATQTGSEHYYIILAKRLPRASKQALSFSALLVAICSSAVCSLKLCTSHREFLWPTRLLFLDSLTCSSHLFDPYQPTTGNLEKKSAGLPGYQITCLPAKQEASFLRLLLMRGRRQSFSANYVAPDRSAWNGSEPVVA